MNKRAQRAHKHAQKNLKRKLLAKARLRDEGLRKMAYVRSNQETLLKASYEEQAAYRTSPAEEMALREEGLFYKFTEASKKAGMWFFSTDPDLRAKIERYLSGSIGLDFAPVLFSYTNGQVSFVQLGNNLPAKISTDKDLFSVGLSALFGEGAPMGVAHSREGKADLFGSACRKEHNLFGSATPTLQEFVDTLKSLGLFDEKMVEFFNHPEGLFFREKLVRENRERGFIPFFYSSQKDEGLVH